MRLARRLLLLSTTLLVASASSASASTQIGQILPVYTAATCGSGAIVQTGVQSGTRSYTVPAGGGVITSWQTATGPSSGQAKLKVFRATGRALEYQIVGEDGPRAVGANTSPIFSTGIRVPVQAGDVIGLTGFGTNCIYYQPGTTYSMAGFGIGVDPAPGSTASTTGGVTTEGAEVSAWVEADADRDGYGDETQDQCTNDAAAQVPPCNVQPVGPPAPEPNRPPEITLSGRSSQAVLSANAVIEIAKANEDVTFRASGSISIVGGSSISLIPTSKPGSAGVLTTLRLALTRVAKRKVRRALSKGIRVRASIHVNARDAGGLTSNANHTIRIKAAQRRAH